MSNSCETPKERKSWREYLRSREFLKSLIAILVGGAAGFLYYYFIGCSSGSCAITSSPYASVAFGGFFGYFLVSRPCGC